MQRVKLDLSWKLSSSRQKPTRARPRCFARHLPVPDGPGSQVPTTKYMYLTNLLWR